MTTIQGNRNVLLGAGAALPDWSANDQVAIGGAESTAYMAWNGAGPGVYVAGLATAAPALAIGANTALTLGGVAGAAGSALISGGPTAGPSWGAIQTAGASTFSQANYAPTSLAAVFTATGTGTATITLPSAGAGARTLIKNMKTDTSIVTVAGAAPYSMYPISSAVAVSSIQLAAGSAAGLFSDGAKWYQTF
ncbi:MAG: hypothetical protein EBS05_21870 [Proteobacteria bacterium]|nr:hypothetical protein [Pseudomonadota bacterium]